MTQPSNATPAASAEPDGHLGEIAIAAAILLLLGHADAAEALEHRVAEAAARPVIAAAQELLRWATRLWQTRFGDLDARIDEGQWADLRAHVVRETRDAKPADPTEQAMRSARQAHALGVKQAAESLHIPTPPEQPLEKPTVELARDTGRAVDTRYAATERLLTSTPVESLPQLVQALAPTMAAASDVDRIARTVVNTAVNDGAQKVAVEQDADLLWFAERDACFIASTRVLAPAVLGDTPGGPAGGVASGPLDGLPLDPTPLGMSLTGDPGALAASASARPMRDRFGEVQAVSSREYVGDVVRIRTASGKDLTGTPNHPVATRGGWVPLGQLKVGDHIFSRTSRERVPLGVDPYDDSAPPTIEQVAQAFPVTVRVVPTAAEDFHGDGAGSDVHVVRTDGLLLDQIHAASSKHLGQLGLQRGDVCLPQLTSARLGFLGRIRALAARVGLRGTRDDHTTALGAELVRPAEVIPDGQPVALEPTPNRDHVDAVDYGDFLGRLAGLVEPDEVVEVGRREFRGQVLNLETVEGWYLAEDIAVHNCVVCLALQGLVVKHDESFPAKATFGDKPTAWWTPPGVTLLRPPRHPRCRCRVEPYLGHAGPPGSLTLPQALRREAERSVLKGWSVPSESEQVRLRAADRLLKRGTDLPRSVQDKARNAVRRGHFTSRDVPQPAAR